MNEYTNETDVVELKDTLGQKVKRFYKKNKTKIWVVTTFVSTMAVSRKVYKTTDEIRKEDEDVMELDSLTFEEIEDEDVMETEDISEEE